MSSHLVSMEKKKNLKSCFNHAPQRTPIYVRRKKPAEVSNLPSLSKLPKAQHI